MTRVFGVDYKFLSCGDVFTQGLVHAAAELGVEYAHADWSDHALAKNVRDFQPDLMLVVHGRRFAQRWKQQRMAAKQTAVWLVDEPYEVDDTSRWSSQFDLVCVNDRATLHRHQRAVYLPTCYDPVRYTPGDGPRPYAVGFIGGGNQTRDRYLSALTDRGLLSYVIGGPWRTPSVQQLCTTMNITAAETARWYQQTQIVLNVYRETHHYNAQKVPATALNPRVYEALACGALVVSEWRPEAETVVPSLPTFRTVDEAVACIESLRADPQTAETIRQRCAAEIAPHTYAARLRTVLQSSQIEVAA